MPVNLFVKRGEYESLRDFAESACNLLGLGGVEEGHSANYWGDVYFVGHAEDASFVVAAADEVAFEDFDFWIAIKPRAANSDAAALERLGDETARLLAAKGFDVAQPFSSDDWLVKKPFVKRVRYSPNRNRDAGGSVEEVLTYVEEIPVAD